MTPTTPDTGRTAPPLFERFPLLAERLPYRALGEWPTPVERFELDEHTVWMKRDDISGSLYGGNKVRKLELLLPAARARGQSGVWTVGAIGSHHCLATAIYGQSAGLDVEVVQFPQLVTDHVRHNILALHGAGARLRLVSRRTLPLHMAWRYGQGLRIKDIGSVAPGGSSPLGSIGFVNAAFELADQIERGELPAPEQIYVAAGTCGTAAGLAVGCALAGLPSEVVGVRVVDRELVNRATMGLLVWRTVRALERAGLPAAQARRARGGARVSLIHDQFGADYGVPTRAGEDACEAARAAGAPRLEHTYTGKALAALRAEAAQGRLPKTVLFWNTFNSRPIDRFAAATSPMQLPEPYRRFFSGG